MNIEGINGWLFPDGNADILAEKILAVIAQRKILADMAAPLKVWEERADWKKNFAKLLEAYEQTIQF